MDSLGESIGKDGEKEEAGEEKDGGKDDGEGKRWRRLRSLNTFLINV